MEGKDVDAISKGFPPKRAFRESHHRASERRERCCIVTAPAPPNEPGAHLRRAALIGSVEAQAPGGRRLPRTDWAEWCGICWSALLSGGLEACGVGSPKPLAVYDVVL